eukprot:9481629-Pyramimonas_sp.AAC.1
MSWYQLSFDCEPELLGRHVPVTRAMTDFKACRWPEVATALTPQTRQPGPEPPANPKFAPIGPKFTLISQKCT